MQNPPPDPALTQPCPACDLAAKTDATTLDALALGVSLGVAFEHHAVTEMMCRNHRTAYVVAMMRAIPEPREPRRTPESRL